MRQAATAATSGGKPAPIVDPTRKPGLELLNQPGFHPYPVVAQACGNEQPIAGGIETGLLPKNPTEVMKQGGEQLWVGQPGGGGGVGKPDLDTRQVPAGQAAQRPGLHGNTLMIGLCVQHVRGGPIPGIPNPQPQAAQKLVAERIIAAAKPGAKITGKRHLGWGGIKPIIGASNRGGGGGDQQPQPKCGKRSRPHYRRRLIQGRRTRWGC